MTTITTTPAAAQAPVKRGGPDNPPKSRTRAAVAPPVRSTDGVTSVFEELRRKIYDRRFLVELHVGCLVGGTPTNRNVAEGWIRTKMGQLSDELVTAEVEKVMEDRGVTGQEAAKIVAKNRSLSGFRRDFKSEIAVMTQERAATEGVWVLDEDGETQIHRVFTPEEARRTFGELYIEGRQVKAMIKEAAMIAVAAKRVEPKGWGETKKGMLGFLVEHLFVEEEKLLLGVTDPSEVVQSFVHTWRGSGIKLEERIRDAVVTFTLAADFDFEAKSKDFYGHVLVTGEENGLGASRSQGFGRFRVTQFKQL